MQRNSKVVLSLVAILAVAAVIFYIKFLRIPEVPRDVLPSESYPEGTSILLYENVPTGFPRSVVLENEPLKYSGAVTLPGGKTQMTVSYVSTKTVPDIRNLYVKTLPAFGWEITQKSVYEKVSIIKANKGAESLTISIAPIRGEDVLVTLQYEK